MLRASMGLFFALAIARGADFSGIWTGVLADRNGDLQDLSFRFTQQQNQLTGKMYGDNESIPITEGKIDGEHITFVVATELNGSISKTLFAGTLAGGQIQVTRGKADAPDAGKPNPKQSFVLKRL